MADNSYIERLKKNYQVILTCRLVKQKRADFDHIPYFQALWTDSLPKNDAEKEVAQVIIDLKNSSRAGLWDCFYRAPWYVLLAGPDMMLQWFRLENSINITWNREKCEYDITVKEDPYAYAPESVSRGRGRGARGRGGRGGRGRGGRGVRDEQPQRRPRSEDFPTLPERSSPADHSNTILERLDIIEKDIDAGKHEKRKKNEPSIDQVERQEQDEAEKEVEGSWFE